MVIVHSYVKLPEATHSSKIKNSNPTKTSGFQPIHQTVFANQLRSPLYIKHNMDPAKVPLEHDLPENALFWASADLYAYNHSIP